MIDYVGAILTLVGCGLLILPLIWVRLVILTSENFPYWHRMIGRRNIPMEISHRTRPFMLWCPRGVNILHLGMERRCVSACTKSVYTPSSLTSYYWSFAVVVYIFKHITVTGVYITMFIKCVSTFHLQISHWTDNLPSGFIFFSSMFYLPQFFQVALGYSPTRSGVFLIPVLVSVTIASFISVSLLSSSWRLILEITAYAPLGHPSQSHRAI